MGDITEYIEEYLVESYNDSIEANNGVNARFLEGWRPISLAITKSAGVNIYAVLYSRKKVKL